MRLCRLLGRWLRSLSKNGTAISKLRINATKVVRRQWRSRYSPITPWTYGDLIPKWWFPVCKTNEVRKSVWRAIEYQQSWLRETQSRHQSIEWQFRSKVCACSKHTECGRRGLPTAGNNSWCCQRNVPTNVV